LFFAGQINGTTAMKGGGARLAAGINAALQGASRSLAVAAPQPTLA